jgi:hypothetical protein
VLLPPGNPVIAGQIARHGAQLRGASRVGQSSLRLSSHTTPCGSPPTMRHRIDADPEDPEAERPWQGQIALSAVSQWTIYTHTFERPVGAFAAEQSAPSSSCSSSTFCAFSLAAAATPRTRRDSCKIQLLRAKFAAPEWRAADGRWEGTPLCACVRDEPLGRRPHWHAQ